MPQPVGWTTHLISCFAPSWLYRPTFKTYTEDTVAERSEQQRSLAIRTDDLKPFCELSQSGGRQDSVGDSGGREAAPGAREAVGGGLANLRQTQDEVSSRDYEAAKDLRGGFMAKKDKKLTPEQETAALMLAARASTFAIRNAKTRFTPEQEEKIHAEALRRFRGESAETK